MRRAVAIAALAMGAPLLSGCVAVAIPALAAGAMVRGQSDDDDEEEPQVAPTPAVVSAAPTSAPPQPAATAPATLAAEAAAIPATIPAPIATRPASTPPSASAPAPVRETIVLPPPPAGTPQPAPVIAMVPTPPRAPAPAARPVQGPPAPGRAAAVPPPEVEAVPAAASQPRMTVMAGAPFDGGFGDFLSFAQRQMQRRAEGESPASVVLVRNFSLDRPEYVACGERPPAVIIDLDDSVLGSEPVIGSAPTGWQASAGLADGLERLRTAGVAILWMTDAPFYQLDEIRARLRETGLDGGGRDPIYAQRGSSDRKQLRRLDAAAAWCIVAAAGDRQADLDEVYDYLVRPEAAVQLDRLWDQGWFITPAPIQRTPPAAAP